MLKGSYGDENGPGSPSCGGKDLYNNSSHYQAPMTNLTTDINGESGSFGMQGLSLLYQTNSSKSVMGSGALQKRPSVGGHSALCQDADDIDAFYMKEN